MTTIKQGISLTKKGPGGPSKPLPGKRKPIFGGDDDSDAEETTTSTSKKQPGLQEITTFDEDSFATSQPIQPPSTSQPKFKVPALAGPPPKLKFKSTAPEQSSHSLSTLRSTAQATTDVEPSLYDYDTFHSASATAARARKEASASSSTNGPDYMSSLLAAAEQRKRDQLRAKDRLLQRERETEGDEFKEKDMFVTEAYKTHQAEMRAAEEAEAKGEEEEAKKRNAGVGMRGFYKGVIDEEEKRHREIQELAKKMKENGVAADDDDEAAEKERSEAELAQEMRARGMNVELNEEGQAVDKRDLLSGGLNVVAKPKPAPSKSAPSTLNSTSATQGSTLAGRGNVDAKRAMRERQTRMMEQQLEQAQKRQAEEEAEEVQKRERAAKSQKTGTEISSARERYLARKKEAEAAKVRGDG